MGEKKIKSKPVAIIYCFSMRIKIFVDLKI